jgi:hypothetical protein
MPEYRLFRLDRSRHICGPAVVASLDDDDAAIRYAIDLEHENEVEIWCGARWVGHAPAPMLTS